MFTSVFWSHSKPCGYRKRSGKFWKSTLTAVIEARAKATSVNINQKPGWSLHAKVPADTGWLEHSLAPELWLSVEKYPELKATRTQWIAASLKGLKTGSCWKKKFQWNAQAYNTYLRSFPAISFQDVRIPEKGLFPAQSGAEKPRELNSIKLYRNVKMSVQQKIFYSCPTEEINRPSSGRTGDFRWDQVHIENTCKEDVLDRAAYVFHKLRWTGPNSETECDLPGCQEQKIRYHWR